MKEEKPMKQKTVRVKCPMCEHDNKIRIHQDYYDYIYHCKNCRQELTVFNLKKNPWE